MKNVGSTATSATKRRVIINAIEIVNVIESVCLAEKTEERTEEGR